MDYTHTTSTHWDVKYNADTRAGSARHGDGGRTGTFTVQENNTVVFLGFLPPNHVIKDVQRWITWGCPEG